MVVVALLRNRGLETCERSGEDEESCQQEPDEYGGEDVVQQRNVVLLEEHLDVARVFGVGMLEARFLGVVGVWRAGGLEMKGPGVSTRAMNLDLESRHLVFLFFPNLVYRK